MKMKSRFTVVLVLFVLASLAYLAVGNFLQKSEIQAGQGPVATQVSVASLLGSPRQGGPPEAEHVVVAYYFHGTYRCSTCLRIEQYSREALEAGFPEGIESGRLEWYAVNVEEPQNEHFVEDYELTTRSLVLVEMEGGEQTRWKNLQRVWELVADREAFMAYVQQETRSYLGGS
jgi:hypothetical protein